MRKTAIALAAVGLLSAFTVAVPPSAEAHGWDHRGREHAWRDHHNSGAAIGLGILGGILAGTAVASSQHYYQAPATYYAPSPYYGYAGYGYYR